MLEPLLLQIASINGSDHLSRQFISPVIKEYASSKVDVYQPLSDRTSTLPNFEFKPLRILG